VFFRLFGGHQAAVRAQQRDIARHAARAQALAQVADVLAHHRAHGSIGHGGQGAFVFLHFGQDDMAERDRHVRHDFRGQFPHTRFVRAVQIGVHQRNGEGLHALRLQAAEGSADVVIVDGTQFVAARIHAALDLDRVFQSGERFGLGPDDPAGEAARDEGARNLHDLPVTVAGDEADARALALEHGIGRHRGAMQEELDFGGRDACTGADRIDAGQHAFGAVMRGGRGLVAPERTAALIEQQKVGECAANVDTQSVGHAFPNWLRGSDPPLPEPQA
jgi:hypothetical protein